MPSLDFVCRDFLTLEDTNHFPDNDVLNHPKKVSPPENSSRGAPVWSESIPTQASEEEGVSLTGTFLINKLATCHCALKRLLESDS